MNKTKKNARGITLIALVITTIVLLILAGVAIAALSGDNGILTRAKEAKEKTAQAQKEEEKTFSKKNILLIVLEHTLHLIYMTHHNHMELLKILHHIYLFHFL